MPDFRLVDYLVSLMRKDQSPALDGTPGNSIRLGNDLAQMGIFDTCMPLYQLVRLREFARMDLWASFREPAFKDIIRTILPDLDLDIFLAQVKMPRACLIFWYLPGLLRCWNFSAMTCP